MNLAEGVNLEDLIMSKDELSGADVKVTSITKLQLFDLLANTAMLSLKVKVRPSI